jgi:hypothetical protein
MIATGTSLVKAKLNRNTSRIFADIFQVSILVGRPEGRRPLGRHRRRWEDNIKMDLQEV